MAQLVGVTRQGWYKIERTGTVTPPIARLLAYIEAYGPEVAMEMARKPYRNGKRRRRKVDRDEDMSLVYAQAQIIFDKKIIDVLAEALANTIGHAKWVAGEFDVHYAHLADAEATLALARGEG
jgi:hypothetical protein